MMAGTGSKHPLVEPNDADGQLQAQGLATNNNRRCSERIRQLQAQKPKSAIATARQSRNFKRTKMNQAEKSARKEEIINALPTLHIDRVEGGWKDPQLAERDGLLMAPPPAPNILPASAKAPLTATYTGHHAPLSQAGASPAETFIPNMGSQTYNLTEKASKKRSRFHKPATNINPLHTGLPPSNDGRHSSQEPANKRRKMSNDGKHVQPVEDRAASYESSESWPSDNTCSKLRPSVNDPCSEQSYEDQGIQDQPTGEQPTGDQPTGDQPTGDQLTRDQPTAKALTSKCRSENAPPIKPIITQTITHHAENRIASNLVIEPYEPQQEIKELWVELRKTSDSFHKSLNLVCPAPLTTAKDPGSALTRLYDKILQSKEGDHDWAQNAAYVRGNEDPCNAQFFEALIGAWLSQEILENRSPVSTPAEIIEKLGEEDAQTLWGGLMEHLNCTLPQLFQYQTLVQLNRKELDAKLQRQSKRLTKDFIGALEQHATTMVSNHGADRRSTKGTMSKALRHLSVNCEKLALMALKLRVRLDCVLGQWNFRWFQRGEKKQASIMLHCHSPFDTIDHDEDATVAFPIFPCFEKLSDDTDAVKSSEIIQRGFVHAEVEL